ncbi:MAG: hypothetical protein WB611_20305, partial [Stellaceae bacterium]
VGTSYNSIIWRISAISAVSVYPFNRVVGVSIIGVWALQWYWLPEHLPVGRRFGFIAHFKEVGRNKGLWLVLLANFFYHCGPGDLNLPRRLSGAHLWNDTGRRCSTSGSGRGRSHFG